MEASRLRSNSPEALADVPSEQAAAEADVAEDEDQQDDQEVGPEEEGQQNERRDPADDVQHVEEQGLQGKPESWKRFNMEECSLIAIYVFLNIFKPLSSFMPNFRS